MTAAGVRERREAVLAALDRDLVVELARQALRIPSYSGDEEGVARFFVDAMERLGIEAELQPVPATDAMGASYNALGWVGSTGRRARVMLNGHIDHNPVSAGWSVDPFGGVLRDGWLYGFVHMKAACAAYVAAAHAVTAADVDLSGGAVLALVCGELRGGVGTQHLLAEGITSSSFVLGEPTDLQLGVRNPASVLVRLHVRGSMRHFSTREVPGVQAVNAVEKMAAVIPALGPSHTPQPSIADGGWLSYDPTPGFETLPQLNVGPVRGGIGPEYDASRPALFPDRCTVVLDIRIVPGMTKDSIKRDLERLVHRLQRHDPQIDVEIEFGPDQFPLPFEGRRDSDVARVVADAHRRLSGEEPQDAAELLFAASDASWLAAAGIEGVVYGPAGRYLSRPDERCRASDVVRAAEVYAMTLVDLGDAADEPSQDQ